MSKRKQPKPILVILDKTRHKKKDGTPAQAWVFTIDMPGPQKAETKRERYSTPQNCKRGARNQITGGAIYLPGNKMWWSSHYGCEVKFVYAKKTSKK